MKPHIINLDVRDQPQTLAHVPKSAEDKLIIIENILAQNGLQWEDVTLEENAEVKGEIRWYGLTKFEGRVMPAVKLTGDPGYGN